MNRAILVSDFDGTITDYDFFLLIRERHMAPDAPDDFALYRAGEITHFEAMRRIFAHAPSDAAGLEALLQAASPDPNLASAARCLEQHGWDLAIVSAGSSWYIERILGAAGVRAAVHSNPGRPVAGGGLAVEHPPKDSPFYSEQVGVDKAAVVHDALARYERVAFAGDGPPDVKPALLVPPERRFARRFLAEELTRLGEPFQPYSSWAEVVSALTGGCR